MQELVENAIASGMTYDEYKTLVSQLVSEKKTSGPNQTEALIHYTKMADVRMRRLDKTTQLLPEVEQAIKGIDHEQDWLILSEAWCGDAGQILPVLWKMGILNPLISIRIVMRDENLDLMDNFLTNGGRSIPKIIVWNKSENSVLGTYGPRPSELQELVHANRNSSDPIPYDEFSKEIQKWYLQDKGISIQKEFMSALGL